MSVENLLHIDNLNVVYPGRGRRKPFHALHDVSIHIQPGETLGLVGESGSGKTTLGRTVLGLAPVTSGSIHFSGQDIAHASRGRRRELASSLQVVFQDPYSSFNPVLTVGEALEEPLLAQGHGRRHSRQRAADLVDLVGLPSETLQRYPGAFSGGQRQRLAIARALALDPALIVCDEPVSALDLTTQARIMDLFIDIQRETGVAYLFISHDLTVVRHISHRVAVMYKGEIVETGTAQQVTEAPTAAYTQKLLLASPVPHPARQQERRQQRLAALAHQSD